MRAALGSRVFVVIVLAAAGFAGACKSVFLRVSPTAVSGPLCTARAASGTSHCDPPPSCTTNSDGSARCQVFTLHAISDPSGILGTTYWYAWWVRPKDRTQAQIAGRVPLMFVHGMGMNDGWKTGLDGAQGLADRTGRPVIYVAELVGGYTSQMMSLKGHGDATGRSINDIVLAGSNLASYSWEGAWLGSNVTAASSSHIFPCSGGKRVFVDTDGQRKCMDCAGWYADSNYLTGLRSPAPVRQPACYKQVRVASTYTGSVPWTIQKARSAMIAGGLLPSTQQIDVIAHSAGAQYIAAAIANHNGKVAGPTATDYTGFYAAIRNVITAHGMHLGVIDYAKADAEGFRSADPYGWYGTSRPTFINTWRANSRFASVRWYALRAASCARDVPWQAAPAEGSYGNMGANYAFGFSSNKDLKHLTNFCGSKNWKGDRVVPAASQGSPWLNSYGFAETICGRSVVTYKDFEFDCGNQKKVRTSAGTTITATGAATHANYDGEKRLWKGDHRWLISPEGMVEVLTTVEQACVASGASCQYEVSCYTGPAGTLDVGSCRAGHRFTTDSAGVCHGQVLPAAEICNGIDDDCDGVIDENGGTISLYLDHDRDTYGSGTLVSLPGCAGWVYPGYSSNNSDCNDHDDRVFPSPLIQYQTLGIEHPNGAITWDFNCDGHPDPHCGDYLCDSGWGEDSYTCEADCGPPYQESYCADGTPCPPNGVCPDMSFCLIAAY